MNSVFLFKPEKETICLLFAIMFKIFKKYVQNGWTRTILPAAFKMSENPRHGTRCHCIWFIPLQWPVYRMLHSMFYLRVCRVLFSNKRPAQLSTISFRKSRHLRRINVCLHATCLCLPEINMRLHAVYICLHASARNACLFTFAWVRQKCQCLQLRGCKHCADYSSDLRYWNISNKVEF